MKICSACHKQKVLSAFNFRDKKSGIHQNQCKECTRKIIRVHYLNNKSYYLKKARIRNTRIRNEIKIYIWNYLKSHSCVDCSENDRLVLEFDHIRDKLFTISLMPRSRTLKQVVDEIKKCEVRCANCHRRKTIKQFGWYKNFL